MLIQINDSQLLMFPTHKILSYYGSPKDELKFRVLNIKIIECDKDLSNFDYMGKVTGHDEVTLLVNPVHYRDLIQLHMCKQKPNTMFLEFNKKNVSYYGFNC
jgi:hypothetical protein